MNGLNDFADLQQLADRAWARTRTALDGDAGVSIYGRRLHAAEADHSPRRRSMTPLDEDQRRHRRRIEPETGDRPDATAGPVHTDREPCACTPWNPCLLHFADLPLSERASHVPGYGAGVRGLQEAIVFAGGPAMRRRERPRESGSPWNPDGDA